jgi:hypothetical protein
MNVKVGTEAAQFPEKEYINGIFVAVRLVGNTDYVLVQIKPGPYVQYLQANSLP